MNSVPAQVAVVVASTTTTITGPSQQLQKDILEEPLNRQNTLNNRQRFAGGKGKHLTRSHAMRESTSPPRTPTPRSPSDIQHNNTLTIAVTEPQSSLSPTAASESRLYVQHNQSSPLLDTPSSQQQQQQQQHQQKQISPNTIYNNSTTGDSGGKSQLDLDFPKLTPPKSTFINCNNINTTKTNNGRNNNNNNNNNYNLNSSSSSSSNSNSSSNAKSDIEKAEQINNNNKNNNNQFINNNTADIISSASHTQQPQIINDIISHNNNNNNNNSSISSSSHISNSQYENELNVNVCETNISSGLLIVTSAVPAASLTPIAAANASAAVATSQTSSSSPISISSNNNYCDKENRNPREINYNSSNNNNNNNNINNSNSNSNNNQINIQFSHDDNRYIHCESPDSLIRNSNLNKKHRTGGAAAKGTKPRLKHMSGGSSSSVEGGCGGTSSGFMSRDSSSEQFTDQSGIDLIQFFKETLNKNVKDRNMLMKIEKELLALALDRTRNQVKFPPMSSYNRMLIHRVAAYFGMEHNVDTTQQSVIAAITKATRVPEIRFKTLIKDTFSEEPRKSILKRDTHSFDEYRQGFLHCPERGILDRKAKSFEEREEEYEKHDPNSEEQWQWMQSEHIEPNTRLKVHNNRLLKVQSVSIEARSDERPCVSKSHSFGGYGGSTQSAALLRGDSITSTKSAGARFFSKQDSNASTNTPWRLSPSSSGYKTQSIRSDSVTPSPTGYGSGDHTPEPCIQSPASTCGVMWAVSDMASVPKGSVLIDPQTLQPIVNQDGSIYHFDPSNLPATTNMTNKNHSHKKKFEKQKSFKNNENGSESQMKNDCLQQSTATITEEVNEMNYEATKLITKDNHDIEENSSLNEEISQANNSISCNELSATKHQKHQATSPLLAACEIQPIDMNEINSNQQSDDNNDLIDAGVVISQNCPDNDSKSIIVTNESSENTQEINKKDDIIKSTSVQSVPLINYSTSATPNSSYTANYDTGSNNGGTTIYSTGTPGSLPTYQTAPDGTIYALPSPLVYTYPSAMDPELSGYFVPVYDQQRDPNMCAASGASLYQTTPGATSTVLPLAYTPTAAYSGAPLYQNPVMYSSEQFQTVPATAAGQLQQYPISYPIGYSYPFNGATYQNYWNQPVTYYVPQTSVQSAGSTPIIMPPPVSQTPTSGMIATQNSMQCGGKRNNTPPNHNHQSQNQQQSASATPVPMSPYTTNLPVPLPDPSSATMYAIPQPLYSNMLPFAGHLAHHHQHGGGGLINSVLPTSYHHQSSNPANLDAMSSTNGSTNNIYTNSNNTNGATPQSTPSTPLSLPLPLPPHSKNPPLFATPPIIPNGFTPQMGTNVTGGHPHHNQNYDERKSNGGYQNKRQNSGNYFNYNNNNNNNNSRQMTPNNFQGNTNGPKTHQNYSNSSNTGNNQNGGTMAQQQQQSQLSASQQKPRVDNKPPLIPTLPNHNNNNNINNNNNSDKTRINRSSKPPNLDLKRNFNNFNNVNSRNTPSTNSTESNNSPNSITSSSAHDHHPHNPHTQPQQQQHHYHNSNQHHQSHHHHQQPYYVARGGSVGSNNGSNTPATIGGGGAGAGAPPHTHHLQSIHSSAVAAAAAAAVAADPYHQPLISTYNPATGMSYVKFGQTYFTHPSLALPQNRRSPPTDIRPITGVYQTMNMMVPGNYSSRHITPRPQHNNQNYNKNKSQR